MTTSQSVLADETVTVPLDELTLHPGNAKRHDLDLIRESLRRFGQYRAAVVQRSTGYVCVGNGMVEAARLEGWSELGAVYRDIDDAEARDLLLLDNRTQERGGGYDDDALAALLNEQRETVGLDGTGWRDAEHDRLLAQINADRYGDDAEQEHESEPYSRFTRDAMIEAAYEHFRGFTVDELIESTFLPVGECMRQLDALARTETSSLLHSSTAYRVPDRWHAHRYDVPIPGKRSVREVFGRDEYLRHALGQLLDGDAKLSPATLLSQLAFTRNAQLAANFRPAFALLMYRTYAPHGGRVLDQSTGFGGRLLGFLASRCAEYVGIDPSSRTSAGNRELLAALPVIGRAVTLIEKPAEDVTADELGGADSIDFAFTSPPYFGKEQYADEPTQSFARYPTGDGWRDGFLAPMLATTHTVLKPGAHALVNIADVKIGTETYPLVEWTRERAAAIGFDVVRTDRFPLGRVPGRGEAADRYEPIVVLRKRDTP